MPDLLSLPALSGISLFLAIGITFTTLASSRRGRAERAVIAGDQDAARIDKRWAMLFQIIGVTALFLIPILTVPLIWNDGFSKGDANARATLQPTIDAIPAAMAAAEARGHQS